MRLRVITCRLKDFIATTVTEGARSRFMFGLCVAGRLVNTDVTIIDEQRAYFSVPNASQMNHICVFLLGTTPFPDGYGATVHLHWPGKGFQLLGG
jgi:protein Hikeshi